MPINLYFTSPICCSLRKKNKWFSAACSTSYATLAIFCRRTLEGKCAGVHSLANLLRCNVWMVVRLPRFCVVTFFFHACSHFRTAFLRKPGKSVQYNAKNAIVSGRCLAFRVAVRAQDRNKASVNVGQCIITDPIIPNFN